MTPLEIDIVLWYGTRALDYRDGDLNAPAVRDAIDAFTKGEVGLLELDPDRHLNRTYRLTARGRAYFNALCALPLPTCQWVIAAPPTVVSDYVA